MPRIKPLIVCTALFALSACGNKDNQLVVGGITATRSACTAVGVPAQTGDVTLFNPENSRDASAIDVVATITNLRSTCDETGADIVTNATFDVVATRANASGAREVVLPYFSTVVRAGRVVVAKRVSNVAIRFEDGQIRGTGRGTASSAVNRSAATLPEEVRERITRKRRPGEEDAAIDPLAVPEVRDAVSRASFELLVGFQLTDDQLKYNATR